MFVVATWKVADGPHNPESIESEACDVLDGRNTCVLHGGARIATLESERDFLRLHERLTAVADAYPGQFTFAAFAVRRGERMSCNADYDRDAARTILEYAGGQA